MKAASYKKSECCGANCDLLDCYDDQPCWGEVDVIDEDWTEDDWWWVHACEGHRLYREGTAYIPEPVLCPLCNSPDTEMRGEGPSGYCRKCGATWAEYISITIKVGEEADETST